MSQSNQFPIVLYAEVHNCNENSLASVCPLCGVVLCNMCAQMHFVNGEYHYCHDQKVYIDTNEYNTDESEYDESDDDAEMDDIEYGINELLNNNYPTAPKSKPSHVKNK